MIVLEKGYRRNGYCCGRGGKGSYLECMQTRILLYVKFSVIECGWVRLESLKGFCEQ